MYGVDTQGVKHKVAFFDVDAVVPGGGGAPTLPRVSPPFPHPKVFFFFYAKN